jgi:hypothetical protein
VSAFFKKTIADFLHQTPCSEGTRLFLLRLRDDDSKRVDHVWQGLIDRGQPDSTEERAAFVRCLATIWKGSEASLLLADYAPDRR